MTPQQRLEDAARGVSTPLVLLSALVANKVSFTIFGGSAEILHGSPKPEYHDLDLILSWNLPNLKNFRRAVQALEMETLGEGGIIRQPAFDERSPHLALNMSRYIGRVGLEDRAIDVVGKVVGLGTYEDIEKSGAWISIEGNQIVIPALDQLVTARQTTTKASTRTQDYRASSHTESARCLGILLNVLANPDRSFFEP